MKRILIVDDERTARKGLSFTLKSEVEQLVEADNVEQAEAILKQQEFDLAIVDLRLPGEAEGLRLIQSVRRMQPMTQILVITAFGSVDSAVRAMQAGADDYVTKDFSKQELLLKIKRLIDTRSLSLANLKLSSEVKILKERVDRCLEPEQIIAESPAMGKVLDLVKRIGQDNDSTALITGESGTGKELIARAIHANSPGRRESNFVVVDIANMPASLLESQLFGHEKGAFTNAHQQRKGLFEVAEGGTVFLDEIGDFPAEMQVKLLRFLQEKTFTRVGSSDQRNADVRIVAATNRKLESMVQKRQFREDLYYRLNVVRIHVPPLRERKEEIPALIDYFRSRLEADKGKLLSFPEAVLERMQEYDWPGNVRQLSNFMESLFVTCTGEVTVDDLLLQDVGSALGQEKPLFSSLLGYPFKEARQRLLDQFEVFFLKHYMSICDGNISKVAEKVGESREGLSRKVKKYGLKR